MSRLPVHEPDSTVAALTARLVSALDRRDADVAERCWIELADRAPAATRTAPFPVLIALARGDALQALHLLGDLPDDASSGLRALCLRLLGDPSWVGVAREAEEASPDRCTRRAMRCLLGRPTDDE